MTKEDETETPAWLQEVIEERRKMTLKEYTDDFSCIPWPWVFNGAICFTQNAMLCWPTAYLDERGMMEAYSYMKAMNLV